MAPRRLGDRIGLRLGARELIVGDHDLCARRRASAGKPRSCETRPPRARTTAARRTTAIASRLRGVRCPSVDERLGEAGELVEHAAQLGTVTSARRRRSPQQRWRPSRGAASRSASTRAHRADELTLRRLLGDREQRVRRAAERGDDDDRVAGRAAPSMIAAVRCDRLGVADRGAAELADDHATIEPPGRDQELGVEHRRAGGAANRVVSQRDERHVEERILAHAADGDGHPASRDRRRAAAAGGRARRRRRADARARSAARARSGAPRQPRSTSSARDPRSRASRSSTDMTHRVAVLDRDAVGVRADRDRRVVDRASPSGVPSIFWISLSIFGSSSLMYGMTLPRMSSDGTPG